MTYNSDVPARRLLTPTAKVRRITSSQHDRRGDGARRAAEQVMLTVRDGITLIRRA